MAMTLFQSTELEVNSCDVCRALFLKACEHHRDVRVGHRRIQCPREHRAAGLFAELVRADPLADKITESRLPDRRQSSRLRRLICLRTRRQTNRRRLSFQSRPRTSREIGLKSEEQVAQKKRVSNLIQQVKKPAT